MLKLIVIFCVLAFDACATVVYAGNGIDLVGSDSAEVLQGTEDNDTFDSRKGDDRIIMGDGLDVTFWQPGDGNDVVFCGEGLQDVLVVGDNTFQQNQRGEPLFSVDDSPASCRIEPTRTPRAVRVQILQKPSLTEAAVITLVDCEYVICADSAKVGKQVFFVRSEIRRINRLPFIAVNNLVNQNL